MKKDKIKTVWISKYALSTGKVTQMKVRACGTYPEMVTAVDFTLQTFHGQDWHLTKSAACAKAERMKLSKIASLKGQITKLEKMRFEP